MNGDRLWMVAYRAARDGGLAAPDMMAAAELRFPIKGSRDSDGK